MELVATASQTVGPFFSLGLQRQGWDDLTGGDPAGTRIRIEGTVFDGDGEPVPDALIEIWQADAAGRYASGARFRGFGRAATDGAGRYGFTTVLPGAVAAPHGGLQAPHVNVGVFARGLLARLVTRIYFADCADANAADPVLTAIDDADARATLIAQRRSDGAQPAYRFDIVLQGAGETAFFRL